MRAVRMRAVWLATVSVTAALLAVGALGGGVAAGTDTVLLDLDVRDDPRREVPRGHSAGLVLHSALRASPDGGGAVALADPGHGTLRLSPDVAPPEHRVWRLDPHRPPEVLAGRARRDDAGRVVLEGLHMRVHLTPATHAGTPGRVSVLLTPAAGEESCTTGLECPADLEVVYDAGDGDPIAMLLPAVQSAREAARRS